MSGYCELVVWLHEDELTALDEVLKQQGTTAQAYLQGQVEKAFADMVPLDVRRAVQQRIDQERAEANRCFAVFHVTDGGTEDWFLEERKLELLEAAKALRAYLRGKGEPRPKRFTDVFPERTALTPEQFETYVSERLENMGRVAGAFEIDLDQRVFSGLQLMDGWRAYSIEDVCAAANHAFRKERLSGSDRWARLLDRLYGRELKAPVKPDLRGEAWNAEIRQAEQQAPTEVSLDAALEQGQRQTTAPEADMRMKGM